MFELINLNVLYDCWSTVAAKGHFLTLCGQTGSVCSPVTVGVRDLLNNQHILTQLYFLLIRDLGLDYQGF